MTPFQGSFRPTVHCSVRQKMVSASVLTLFHQLLPVAQNHISAPRRWVLRPALPSHLLLAVCVLARNSKGIIALSGTWSHGSVPCTPLRAVVRVQVVFCLYLTKTLLEVTMQSTRVQPVGP